MATPQKRFRLRNLNIDRADLVDIGANQEAHILLYKAAFPMPKRRGDTEDQGREREGQDSASPTDGRRAARPDTERTGRPNPAPPGPGAGSPKEAPKGKAPASVTERPMPYRPGQEQPKPAPGLDPDAGPANLSEKEAQGRSVLIQTAQNQDRIGSVLRARRKRKPSAAMTSGGPARENDEEVLAKMLTETRNLIRLSKHYGPGSHPGTGTSQEEAHGSEGGLRSPRDRRRVRQVGEFNQYGFNPEHESAYHDQGGYDDPTGLGLFDPQETAGLEENLGGKIVDDGRGYLKMTGMQEDREDRSTPKVGDLLVRSWGYDQTNVDAYQVVAISPSGKSVSLRSVGTVPHPTGDRVWPHREKRGGSPDPDLKNRRVTVGSDGYRVVVQSYGNYKASLWDGRSLFETPAGFGH